QLFLIVQVDTRLLQTGTEGVAPRPLAQGQLVGMPTNRLVTHDLVGFAVLEHPVLVTARTVGKGVGADNGLVRLHRETGDARHQARCTADVLGTNTGIHQEYVLAGTQSHDDLFQRGVTSPLAQTVDGAFHRARTGSDRGQRVG